MLVISGQGIGNFQMCRLICLQKKFVDYRNLNTVLRQVRQRRSQTTAVGLKACCDTCFSKRLPLNKLIGLLKNAIQCSNRMLKQGVATHLT